MFWINFHKKMLVFWKFYSNKLHRNKHFSGAHVLAWKANPDGDCELIEKLSGHPSRVSYVAFSQVRVWNNTAFSLSGGRIHRPFQIWSCPWEISLLPLLPLPHPTFSHTQATYQRFVKCCKEGISGHHNVFNYPVSQDRPDYTVEQEAAVF